MRLDNVVVDLTKKLREILLALDNRLTAGDNLGPEGIAGQVLTSNGPNAAPSFQSIDSEVERVLRANGLIT